jgi:hypothetical protein
MDASSQNVLTCSLVTRRGAGAGYIRVSQPLVPPAKPMRFKIPPPVPTPSHISLDLASAVCSKPAIEAMSSTRCSGASALFLCSKCSQFRTMSKNQRRRARHGKICDVRALQGKRPAPVLCLLETQFEFQHTHEKESQAGAKGYLLAMSKTERNGGISTEDGASSHERKKTSFMHAWRFQIHCGIHVRKSTLNPMLQWKAPQAEFALDLSVTWLEYAASQPLMSGLRLRSSRIILILVPSLTAFKLSVESGMDTLSKLCLAGPKRIPLRQHGYFVMPTGTQSNKCGTCSSTPSTRILVAQPCLIYIMIPVTRQICLPLTLSRKIVTSGDTGKKGSGTATNVTRSMNVASNS